MKKRIITLLIAACVLVSITVYCPIYVYASFSFLPAENLPDEILTVVPDKKITWSEEMLYCFELFINSVGVQVTSKAVPAVALAWEAQAKVDSPEFHAELAELSQMDGVERLDSLFGHTWTSSIRDFFTSDSCVGYGTAGFSFGSGLTGFVRECMGDVSNYRYIPYCTRVGTDADIAYLADQIRSDNVEYAFSYHFEMKSGTTLYDDWRIDVYLPIGSEILCFYLDGYFYYVAKDSTGSIVCKPFGFIRTYVHKGKFNDIGTFSYGTTIKGAVDAGSIYSQFPYPLFKGKLSALDWVEKGLTYGALHLPTGVEELDIYNSSLELQTKAITALPAVAPAFTIPETALEREEILAKVREADAPETLVKALAGAGILVGDNVDNPPVTDADVDVTDESAGAIVKALATLQTTVRSIPAQITDFFTVDTIAVFGSFTGLKDALFSRFEPIVKLANAFDGLSYNLETAIPLYKMAVPASMYDVVGDTEIIVFDLRGYEQEVGYFRTFVQVAVWITAAFVFINLFDVKFHVG